MSFRSDLVRDDVLHELRCAIEALENGLWDDDRASLFIRRAADMLAKGLTIHQARLANLQGITADYYRETYDAEWDEREAALRLRVVKD